MLIKHGFSRAEVLAMPEPEAQAYLQLLAPDKPDTATRRIKSLRKKPVTIHAQS